MARLRLLEEKERLEASLIDFVEAAWPSIDRAEYQRSWATDALCEHLEAVTFGEIPRLLANYPPRCSKTTVASVCWPAWTWARSQRSFWSGPSVKFLCGSYNDKLSLQNSNLCRRLMQSLWYQARWGNAFRLTDDQNTKSQYDTTEGGSRIAVSVRGGLLGLGGDVILVDDPHDTEEVESEADRETALNWWSEISSTRLNDPKKSAIVVIMQRLHEEDISGVITKAEDSGDWAHLMIPMRYDWRRHCVTVTGWNDPRGLDGDGEPLVVPDEETGERVGRDTAALRVLEHERQGQLMWEERFGEKEVAALEYKLGPYRASGRLQQMPVPSKGGIFPRDYWQLWEDAPGLKFADITWNYIVASADTAYTEKEENDPTGFTIWGVFNEPKTGAPRVMLIYAWRKHLQMHGVDIPRHHDEEYKDYVKRASPEWGLIEWLAYSCKRFKVDRLLIESKASGITAAQEMQRLHGTEPWAVQLEPVHGDKVARAHSVQPVFSQGLVYAPDKEWAELVMDEMANFPKGKFKDLTDSATQAIRHLRDCGLIEHRHERAFADEEGRRLRKRSGALYPA